jgi:cell division protein FtsL|tara:strand:- start:1111 stop:1362 length:252 start_codon:yes stop_codon:yes gene_type:complete
MKILDYFLAIFFLAFLALSFLKVFLVFEYKRNFMHLDNVQEKIFKLQNQNSKLNVEIALLKSSPYIYDKALALGMTDPDIDDE